MDRMGRIRKSNVGIKIMDHETMKYTKGREYGMGAGRGWNPALCRP
jgi:hypothetical protein